MRQDSFAKLHEWLSVNGELLHENAGDGEGHSLLFYQVKRLLQKKEENNARWPGLRKLLTEELQWLNQQDTAPISILYASYIAAHIIAILDRCGPVEAPAKTRLAAELEQWLNRLFTDKDFNSKLDDEKKNGHIGKILSLLLHSQVNLGRLIGQYDTAGWQKLQERLAVEEITGFDPQSLGMLFRALAELNIQGKTINDTTLKHLQAGLTKQEIGQLEPRHYSNILRALAELGIQGKTINDTTLKHLQAGLAEQKIDQPLQYSIILRALAELGIQGKTVDDRALKHLQTGLTEEQISKFDSREFAMTVHGLASLGVIDIDLFSRPDMASWDGQAKANSVWSLSVALVRQTCHADLAALNSLSADKKWIDKLKGLLTTTEPANKIELHQVYLAWCLVSGVVSCTTGREKGSKGRQSGFTETGFFLGSYFESTKTGRKPAPSACQGRTVCQHRIRSGIRGI